MADGLDTTKLLDEARDTLTLLRARLDRETPELERLNSHYEGTQPLSYMAPELLMELGDRMRQVIIHWPELVIDSVEERLDIEGFRLGDEAEADDALWGIWQANGLDILSHEAHIDALVMKRAYAVVGSRGPDDLDPSSGVSMDVPLVTVESPLQVIATRDPRTRRVREAAKWRSSSPDVQKNDRATLYLPDRTVWLKQATKRSARAPLWVLDEDDAPGIDEHGLGVVPVVPIVNRPRTVPRMNRGEGRSDLDAIIPLSDAACKIATDMMVGAEFHALPRRWLTGVGPGAFVDESGNEIGALSRIAGRIWALEGSSQDVKVGQFPEATLSGFHDTIKMLAQLVASIAGLPPHYLGMATDNPASADAIRSAESRNIKRAERRHRCFGEGWETAMRIAMLIRDGSVPPEAARMETIWRDPATPTVAQKADAAVKLFQAGIVPRTQTWEDLGYSSVQIERMKEDLEEEAERQAAAFGAGAMPQMPGDTPPETEAGDGETETEPGDPKKAGGV